MLDLRNKTIENTVVYFSGFDKSKAISLCRLTVLGFDIYDAFFECILSCEIDASINFMESTS